MRIGVIGIGGVGGYFGGKLAREYANSGKHEVIFIARHEHLKAIQKNGLQLFTQEEDYVVWPNIATDHPDTAGPFDLVFFCVKSYDLELSAGLFSGNITESTVVIPLLNGVDSAERLRNCLPQATVISGSAYIISHVEKPGVIRQEGGACKLAFGTDDPETSQKYFYILDLLKQAKIRAIRSDKITEVLWLKYLLMCPIGSLTSATGKTYGEICMDSSLRHIARQMMQEVVDVAKALQINIPPNAVEKTLEMVAGFDYHSKTSMQLDKEKGHQTEVDTLTGYLCRTARKFGVQTPLHDGFYQRLIH